MDKEQEQMQFLGLIGVYNEAYKIIFSWRKIFTKLTLSLIFPFSFIFLFHIEFSSFLSRKIESNKKEMSQTPMGTSQYEKLSDILSAEGAYYLLIEIAYLAFMLVFSLLSTSAVVYTIASVYTAREITFNKVMSVVPKVWHRLFVTFLCHFVAFLAYNILAVVLVIILALTVGLKNDGNGAVIAAITFLLLSIIYVGGLVYLIIVWQLANIVSVLEESYGFLAMMKSRELIKGKMLLATMVAFILNVSFLLVRFFFQKLVVNGWKLGSVERTAYGIICFLLISKLFLFSLVIQTVLYFVCKSYHHENIDKSALSDHLEVYLGEYAPLKTKDVQLEQSHV